MRWLERPDGGVLQLDGPTTRLGVDLELEIVASDGLTWGMWILGGTDALLAVVAAGRA